MFMCELYLMFLKTYAHLNEIKCKKRVIGQYNTFNSQVNEQVILISETPIRCEHPLLLFDLSCVLFSHFMA